MMGQNHLEMYKALHRDSEMPWLVAGRAQVSSADVMCSLLTMATLSDE